MNWKMMRSLYRWLVISSASVALIYTIVTDLRPFQWTMVIFAALSIYLSNYRVETSKSTFIVLLPLALPALISFGPVWASVIAIISLLSRDEVKRPLPVIMFNDAMITLCVVVAAKVYVLLGGEIGSFHLTGRETIAFFAAGLVFELVNAIIMVTWKIFRDKAYGTIGESYLNYVWHIIRPFLFSTTLGGAALIAYQDYYIIGLLVVFFAALKLREVFMSVEVDEHYRNNAISDVLQAVYAKDAYFRRHLENVARYSLLVAKDFESLDFDIKTFSQAVVYHDIGKLEIPEKILRSPAQLTPEQWKIMKTHPTLGANFINGLKVFNDHQRKMARDIAFFHHERIDGLGYPNHLKGTQIPISARIVAVADSWDAMTTNRPYREALPAAEAKEELRKGKGTQFDPRVVDAFLKAIEKEEKRERRRREKYEAAEKTWHGRLWHKMFWRWN
ncbi:MAG: HD-GYP domain-containing protein [Firmicutes bacterium]|nr:HD-GYP domain-containing protein [Bacillota bacterium]